MRERMFHMVNLIVEFLLKESTLSYYEPEISDLLRSHGFESEEISEAFRWLNHFGPWGENGLVEKEGSSAALRMLSDEERLAFNTEAYGYLLQLHRMGLIDDSMREEIFQRALSLVEEEITRDDIQTMALIVAFHRSQKHWHTDLIHFLKSENQSFLN